MSAKLFSDLLVSATFLAASSSAFPQGAPGTPPPPAQATTTATAVPVTQLTTEQISAELKSLHVQETTYKKDLAAMTRNKNLVRTDGLTKDGVTAKLDELRTRDEELSIEIKRRNDDRQLKVDIDDANRDGVPVQIDAIAHYRGMRGFQLSGIGLVIGLEQTGDTTKSVITQTLYANYFKANGLSTPSGDVAAKNVALVQVNAEMPAFTKPGTKIDVTVSSIGDAKSLQGGYLVFTPLYVPIDHEKVVATASGALSIGGFNASANGSKVQRNHVNVGRVPEGAEVQSRIESQVVNTVGGIRKLYLDLDEPDATTVSRIAAAIAAKYPELAPETVDSTTIAISIPSAADAETTMSKIDQITVFANTPAKIVINERTGTIVVGGNVTIGPAMVVSGNLKIRIDTENSVSQPGPFSGGQTTTVSNSNVSAGQEESKIALIKPTTKIWDLTKLFQALNLQPNDVIQILQALQKQGALKARIELQ